MEKYWINIGEVLELIPGPVLCYTNNSNFPKKMLGGQKREENLTRAPFVPFWSPHQLQLRQGKTICPLLQLHRWRNVQGNQPQTLLHHGAQVSVAGDPPLCWAPTADVQMQISFPAVLPRVCQTVLWLSVQQLRQASFCNTLVMLKLQALSYRVWFPLCSLLSQPSDHWRTTALKEVQGPSSHHVASLLKCRHCYVVTASGAGRPYIGILKHFLQFRHIDAKHTLQQPKLWMSIVLYLCCSSSTCSISSLAHGQSDQPV